MKAEDEVMAELQFWRERAAFEIWDLEEKEARTFTKDDIIHISAVLMLPLSAAWKAFEVLSDVKARA